MQNTNLQLQKWILKNRNDIEQLRHWKRIHKYIIDKILISATAQEVYDILYPDARIECDNGKFISFSVGYRTCSKGCPCYVKNLSEKISNIKTAYSSDKQQQITQQRIETVSKKYGVVNVGQLDVVKEKSKQTKIKKYNSPYFSNPEKSRMTNLQKYGVDNAMKLDRFKEKNKENRDYCAALEKGKLTKLEKYGDENYHNIEQSKKTNLEKYGFENASQSNIIRNKISVALRGKFFEQHSKTYNINPTFSSEEYAPGTLQRWLCNTCGSTITGKVLNGKFTRCLFCNPPTKSREEQEVKDFIKSLGIDIIENSRTIIGPKELDIYIPSKKLAIEYCGMYWHTEAKGKSRRYHQNKFIECNKQGIKLITLFSKDWQDKQEIVKSRIIQYLKINKVKIYARNCIVKEVPHAESIDFLERTHIQGGCNSTVRLGLYLEDQLVSIMTFSKSRFEKNKIELLRFSNELNTTVVGGASKLLRHFIKEFAPSEITSYSNNNWGSSNFYEILGFEKVSSGTPGYFYFNTSTGDYFNRLEFQKHKLSKKLPVYDGQLTEYQNMQNNMFDRIWDCGHSKYVLTITT